MRGNALLCVGLCNSILHTTLVNSVALSFAHFGEGEKMLHLCVIFMKMSEFKRKPQLQTEICIIIVKNLVVCHLNNTRCRIYAAKYVPYLLYLC